MCVINRIRGAKVLKKNEIRKFLHNFLPGEMKFRDYYAISGTRTDLRREPATKWKGRAEVVKKKKIKCSNFGLRLGSANSPEITFAQLCKRQSFVKNN